MDNKLKSMSKLLFSILFLGSMLLCFSCSAHKHHKAVPCPCEKEHKR